MWTTGTTTTTTTMTNDDDDEYDEYDDDDDRGLMRATWQKRGGRLGPALSLLD
jgi:hypothetical protein